MCLTPFSCGRYKDTPRWVICAIVFVLLYVLMPFDVVPDPIPFAGLVDDAVVVGAAIAMLHNEIDKYRKWLEKKNA